MKVHCRTEAFRFFKCDIPVLFVKFYPKIDIVEIKTCKYRSEILFLIFHFLVQYKFTNLQDEAVVQQAYHMISNIHLL